MAIIQEPIKTGLEIELDAPATKEEKEKDIVALEIINTSPLDCESTVAATQAAKEKKLRAKARSLVGNMIHKVTKTFKTFAFCFSPAN